MAGLVWSADGLASSTACAQARLTRAQNSIKERAMLDAGAGAGGCPCTGENAEAARRAIRTGERASTLVDESHFMVSVRRCRACGQTFLQAFCERVDWADGDDPQAWVYIPIDDDEREALRKFDARVSEDELRRVVSRPRRFLHEDSPKGAPRTLAWVAGIPAFPAHD